MTDLFSLNCFLIVSDSPVDHYPIMPHAACLTQFQAGQELAKAMDLPADMRANLRIEPATITLNGDIKESLLNGAAAMVEADMLERELARLRAENALLTNYIQDLIDKEIAAGKELARLREENALLREVLRETVSNVIDYLGNHALEHLQPVTNLIDTEAWHKATNSGATFTAINQPIPDDILSDYTAEEKAQFANDWLAEMREATE